MNIKKSIFKVFTVNFFQLISGLIVGFCVPMILSVEGYANLKTYGLYISYIGLFHLGFIDGLFIKYGGKKYNDIDRSVLKGEHNFLVIMEMIISIILFFVSIIMRNIIIFLFSISILPIMINNFFKYIYQATGEFNKYTKIMHRYNFIYMILNVLLAFVFKNQNYILYCLTTFVANLLAIFYTEFTFLKENIHTKGIIDKNTIKNIKTGFFILLGNLVIIGLFGIDKWFVKLFLSTEDFAYYAFAVSMLNIINTLVNAISITFYNYLFENNDEHKINKLKEILISLGGLSSCAFFALSFIVNYFIKKYIPSLDIIAVTFAAFPYMVLINALYVNLYKVNKDEKHYFRVVITILGISILYNIIALILFHNTISIALATILTLITWVVYSTKDLKNVKSDKKMYMYTSLLTTSFLLCAHFLNWWIGGIIYSITYLIITKIIYRNIISEFIKMIINILKRILKKY